MIHILAFGKIRFFFIIYYILLLSSSKGQTLNFLPQYSNINISNAEETSKEITVAFECDQNARELNLPFKKVDSINGLKLKEIIYKYGFPDRHLFDSITIFRFSILCIHSDIRLRKELKIEQAINLSFQKGDISATIFSTFIDKQRILEHQKQVYGTQFFFDQKDRLVKPFLIDELPLVDERRKNIGLKPLKEYYIELNKNLILKN